MNQPPIFVKTEKEAKIFVYEFLTLLGENRTHDVVIRKIVVLQKKIRESQKLELKINIFVKSIAYNRDLKIVSEFIPTKIKSAFKTYPPYVICLKRHVFDKIKGTENKVNAFTFPFSNCIIITENYIGDIHYLLIHEFLHYASELGSNWSNWRNKVNKYKTWIIEGITELYTKRLAATNHIQYKQHKKYEKYVAAIRPIEALLGKENLKEIYFNGDIGAIFLSTDEKVMEKL